MIDDRLKSKLEKIRELAERGVGGEKETAQRKLEKLLKDNGLTLESLEGAETRFFLFSYTNKHTKKLLVQIIYKILGSDGSDVKCYKSARTRNKLGVYCTASQKLEIELDYDFYLRLFDEEVDSLLSAFIQQQDLFPSDGPVQNVDLDSLSPEDKAKLLKQEAFRRNMQKKSRLQSIEKKF